MILNDLRMNYLELFFFLQNYDISHISGGDFCLFKHGRDHNS